MRKVARKLTNEERGRLATNNDEIVRRIKDGRLDLDWVLTQQQRIVNGKDVQADVGHPLILEVVQDKLVFPGTTKVQQADDLFRQGTVIKKGVRVAYIDSSWTNNFGGMTVQPTPSSKLTARKLLRNSKDTPIIHELGGEEVCAISLAEFYYLLGEIRGYFFAYVKNHNNTLVAADADWSGGDRYLFAYPLDYDDPWRAGHRVVSPAGGGQA